MNARAWVAAAIGAALAAGVALGVTLCRAAAAGDQGETGLPVADRAFLQQFAADLDLRSEQVALLGAILRRRAQDETSIYRRNVQSLPDTVQGELGEARRAADKRIEFMLDASQRARYEQLRKAQDSGR